MVRMASARVVDVPTTEADGFKLNPDALAAAITPKSRALFLNSPSNPTGAVYTRAELEALADVLRDTDVAVISDEIYWPFVYEGEFCSPASVPGLAERTLVVNGASKAYAMTGWRIGWLGAPPNMARAVSNLKSHLTSNASAPAQYAALAALEAGTGHTDAMCEAFSRRRTVAVEGVERLPRVTCSEPAGAFYVFPNVSAWYGSRREGGAAIDGSVAFCTALLENALVAAVPGAAFGEDACIRLSIAASDEHVTEALRRLESFLQTLTPSTLESSA
jgi:aspartate aminotransferase